jgi:hypothetical protein
MSQNMGKVQYGYSLTGAAHQGVGGWSDLSPAPHPLGKSQNPGIQPQPPWHSRAAAAPWLPRATASASASASASRR